jgi:hypothetical protein
VVARRRCAFGRQFSTGRREPNASDDERGRGEKEKALRGTRGNSSAPESTDVDGDVCGLRLQNCTAWRLGSRRGKRGDVGLRRASMGSCWGSRRVGESGERSGGCYSVLPEREAVREERANRWTQSVRERKREGCRAFPPGLLPRAGPVGLSSFFFLF